MITFRKTDTSYAVDRDGKHIGNVIRSRRSTDSRIAGTRPRREGKGATTWKATPAGGTYLQLLHTFGGGYRLSHRGQEWG